MYTYDWKLGTAMLYNFKLNIRTVYAETVDELSKSLLIKLSCLLMSH